MKRQAMRVFFALGLACALGAPSARAGFVASITGTVTSPSAGLYLYTYTLTSAASSTSGISEFDLSLTSGTLNGSTSPGGAPIDSITSPAGFFNLYTPGDASISFLSTDPSTDIKPAAIGVFSFTSTYGPVLQGYSLSTFDDGSAITGQVLAPVPEPASVALLGLGTLGLLGRLALRRRRAVA